MQICALKKWKKELERQPGCRMALRRLADRGHDVALTCWLLWERCNPENWNKLQGSFRANRRNMRRLKQGMNALPNVINQVQQALKLYRCGEVRLQDLPVTLRMFRKWFERNCLLNKSRRLNYHSQMKCLMQQICWDAKNGRPAPRGWETDLANLVNGAFEAHQWQKKRPSVTAASIRRYLQRESLYAKRSMKHFSSIN